MLEWIIQWLLEWDLNGLPLQIYNKKFEVMPWESDHLNNAAVDMFEEQCDRPSGEMGALPWHLGTCRTPHMWPKVQSDLTCTASGTHHCQTLKVVCTFLLHSCQTWKYSSLASDVHITSWKYRVAGPRWQIWRECLLMLSHCTRADTGQVEARWAVCSPVSTEIDVRPDLI